MQEEIYINNRSQGVVNQCVGSLQPTLVFCYLLRVCFKCFICFSCFMRLGGKMYCNALSINALSVLDSLKTMRVWGVFQVFHPFQAFQRFIQNAVQIFTEKNVAKNVSRPI
jgi:hypothetical protein